MAGKDRDHGQGIILAVMAGVFGLLGVGAGSAISYVGLERQLDAESSATVRSDRRAAYERFLELSSLASNLEVDYYYSLIYGESSGPPLPREATNKKLRKLEDEMIIARARVTTLGSLSASDSADNVVVAHHNFFTVLNRLHLTYRHGPQDTHIRNWEEAESASQALQVQMANFENVVRDDLDIPE